MRLDAELSVAQETALLSWLADTEDGDDDEGGLQPDELAVLRARLAGLLDGLPEALRRHLEALMSGDVEIESPGVHAGYVETVDERERADLEEAVRRLIRSLHGAPRSRRTIAARGTVDGARTMRANMGYNGVPFRPVTVARIADRPRLLLLVDVSLSVRTAARFTLQLVHGLQSMAAKVRSFAFVADLAEITDLFNEHPMEEALGLVMAGLPAGGVLDVDADSDYGAAFGTFMEEYGGAINRRTTVIVLGDGRGNGKDPNFGAIAEISRRARELVWLTPEPRYSWRLGSCDLPAYADLLRPGARRARPRRAGPGHRARDRPGGPVTTPRASTPCAPVRRAVTRTGAYGYPRRGRDEGSGPGGGADTRGPAAGSRCGTGSARANWTTRSRSRSRRPWPR